MSLPACLPDLLASGKVRAGDKANAERTYERHFERLRAGMGEDAAAAEASRLTLDELQYARDLKGRRMMLTIPIQQRLDAAMDAAANAGRSPFRLLVDQLKDVEIAQERITFQAHAALTGFIETHRRNLAGGPKNKTGMRDVVIERHGGSTGNAEAKAFSKAIGDTFDLLTRRFNRAGGDVNLRADFGLPHRHDSLRVRGAGYEQWRAAVVPELDLDKMVDPFSGQAFTPDRLEDFLFASWRQISTGGLSPDSTGAAASMLANRRSDHRFMVFKDGEAWLRYNQAYGTGNPFDQVMGHIGGLARDIALMEAFGPNPAATWKRAMQRGAGLDAQSAKALAGSVAGTSAAAFHADRVWRYVNGDFSLPVLYDTPVLGAIHRRSLAALHGTRDLITAAFLGSSQLTAIADLNTQAFTRAVNAMPVVGEGMSYLRQLNPFSHTDRREAIRLGLGMRDASRTMLGIARFMGETHGPAWTQIVADDVLRLSLVNKFTEGGTRAFGQDFLGQLAAERHLGWDELGERRRMGFEANGITPEDWEAIRSADPYRGRRGIDYVDWESVAARDQGASDRMMNMILAETRKAVVMPNIETLALTRFGRPGTLPGEIGANMFQFKSFPVQLIMDQARRVNQIATRFGPRAAGQYGVAFLLGMTVFGAMAIQLREIAKSRDMRAMNGEFWTDAAFQGGGLGIFGDLIGSFSNDRIDSLFQFVGGPMTGLAEDAKHVGQSFFPTEAQRQRGESANPGRAISRFIRRYTPGTTLWYARAAFDRMLFDQIQAEIDPDYYESYQRVEATAARQGQGYWWRPGEMAPDRAPTMGEAPN